MDTSTHPVPQNVTDFQFHLIGDMTLKQFGYLAGGLGTAYLIFVLFSSIAPFVAYPLILLFAGSGFALAFVPIQERPLDIWVVSFLKAVFHPTQLKYKPGTFTKDDPRFNDRLNIYLKTLEPPAIPITVPKVGIPKNTQASIPQSDIKVETIAQAVNRPDFSQPAAQTQTTITTLAQTPPAPKPVYQADTDFSDAEQKPHSVSSVFEANANNPNFLSAISTPPATLMQNTPPAPPVTTQPSPVYPPQPTNPASNYPVQPPTITSTPSTASIPSPQQLQETVELAKRAQNIQSEIVENQHILNQIKINANKPGVDPKVFANQFQQVVNNLQRLNEEASQISKQLENLTPKTPKPKIVKIVPPAKPKAIPTITLTSTPNIINGIVTDIMGNYVEGAIIVAHDKQGLPVRALKSNKLGQFVAATPLPSGTYTMTLEKDDLIFDSIQVDLSGEVLPPILAQAKKPEREIA